MKAGKPKERLDSSRGGENESDSGYILKVSLVRFADEIKRGSRMPLRFLA